MEYQRIQTITSSMIRRSLQVGLLLLLTCSLVSTALAQDRNPQQRGPQQQRRPNGGQNSGQIRRLLFTVKTGDDDLRGGHDNLNVGIHFRDGNVQWKPNVNRGQAWANNTTENLDIALERPAALSQIASIDFQKPAGTPGTYGTDEWHMASVSVRAIGDGIDKVIATHGLMKFSAANPELLIPVTMAVAGKANTLELTVKTGGDNLEGGSYENFIVTIHFRGGGTQVVNNVNGGQEWANNSTHVKTITLDQAVDPSDIVKIDLQAGYSIPASSDNWDMDSISIKAIGDGVDKIIARHGFNRFTGSQTTLSIPITTAEAGKANKLELTIQTGGDDLRGDNDNLNVTIHYRSGRTQIANNINGGRNWANQSMHVETITLDHAADPANIVGVDLETTFTGGSGGDNWDMNSVIVKAIGDGVNEVLFTKVGFPAKRFTADNKILRLRKG